MGVKIYQADSIGEPLARWLDQHPVSRVAARFDSTLQLQGDDGQLWSITAHFNPGAHRVITPTLPAWTIDARAVAHNETLAADGFEVRWNSRALWDPRVKRRALKAEERQSAASVIAEAISGSLDTATPAGWDFAETHGFWNLLSDTWGVLACTLSRQDAVGACASAARLIGRGPGLTPTGDDFIQALLVTLQSGDDADRGAFQVLARAVAPLLPRTTRMSQMFLREALQGWAFGSLKTLLEALPDVSPKAVLDLLRVGATSGPAYALGVLFGLTWNAERIL